MVGFVVVGVALLLDTVAAVVDGTVVAAAVGSGPTTSLDMVVVTTDNGGLPSDAVDDPPVEPGAVPAPAPVDAGAADCLDAPEMLVEATVVGLVVATLIGLASVGRLLLCRTTNATPAIATTAATVVANRIAERRRDRPLCAGGPDTARGSN